MTAISRRILFQSFQGHGLFAKTLDFKYPHKKSGTVKASDGAYGHNHNFSILDVQETKLEIKQPSGRLQRIVVVCNFLL
jgi:hypothetical protein